MMCRPKHFRRYPAQQSILHLARSLAWRKSGAVAEAEDVGVHRHGCLTENHVENHVRGLTADTRQPLECCPVFRHLTAMITKQDFR